MDPTPRTAAWAAWAGWAAVPRDLLERRRLRLTVHQLGDPRDLSDELRRDWARLPPQVALYTPKQIRHLIRLENALGRVPTGAPDRWRRPDPDAYWRVHDFLQNVRLERPPPAETHASSAGGGRAVGWDGAWGWAAGAVLLAALVLLVRALERFLHRRLFKGRRRPSEEWPTPNVLATSHRYGSEIGPPPRLDDSDSFPSEPREPGSDLPPPYSECAHTDLPPETIDPNKPINMEEPPPPYSACYFSNPKDGIPTVHFSRRNLNFQNSEVGQSSADFAEPSISNVRRQDNKISDVGCDITVSLDNSGPRNENETVSADDNAVSEDTNTESVQRVPIRDTEEHIVEIVEAGSSQPRVLAV